METVEEIDTLLVFTFVGDQYCGDIVLHRELNCWFYQHCPIDQVQRFTFGELAAVRAAQTMCAGLEGQQVCVSLIQGTLNFRP